jgi:hypothetical protein
MEILEYIRTVGTVLLIGEAILVVALGCLISYSLCTHSRSFLRHPHATR